MSVAAKHWALSQRVGNSSARIILFFLADWMIGDNVECWPSVETLSFETGMNRKTVMSATALLEKDGLISRRYSWKINEKTGTPIKVAYYKFIGYDPKKWERSKRPCSCGSTEFGTSQNRDVPDLVRPEFGTPRGPKFGTPGGPKFGTGTGNNRNKQGINMDEVFIHETDPDEIPFPDFEEAPPEVLFVVDPEPQPAPEKPKTKRTRAKPKTRCPFDGDRPVLPDEWRDALTEQFPSLDLKHEFKRFVNHHLSKGSVFADWKAAFRNWLTNAVKFQAQNGRFKSGYRPVQNGPTPLAEQDYSTYNDVFGCKIV